MCRRIIEHWAPCNHQRLMHIVPCEGARGTPGLLYEDCADGENSYLEEPSKTPCPVCRRNETFRSQIDLGRTTTVAVATTPRRPNTQKSTRSSIPSLTVCGIGEHDLRDIDNGDFSCIKCAAIRGWSPLSNSSPERDQVSTPLVSFPDDDDHDDVATPLGSVTRALFNPRSESTPSEKTTKANDDTVAEQVHGTVEDAPTPSTMSSNARAEASWRLYEGQLGRRLPDF